MRGLRISAAIASSLYLTALLHAQTSPITTGTLQANLLRTANIPTATQGEPIDLVTAPGDSGNRLVVIALLLVLAGAGISALAFLLRRPDVR